MSHEQVLEGRRHSYVLGPGMGRRLFRGRDDEGRTVVVRIGPREGLLAMAALGRLVSPGLLPENYEYGDLTGGRGFLASEYVPGYALGDLLAEGRMLDIAEARLLTDQMGRTLQGFVRADVRLLSFAPSDIRFDTSAGRFRLVSSGPWARGRGDRPMAEILSGIVLRASDAAFAGDTRFARALRRAEAGEGELAVLRRLAAPGGLSGAFLRRIAALWMF